MKFITPEQIRVTTLSIPSKYQSIFFILSQTGLRVSELINLQPQNIDLQNRVMHIRGKGNKIRNVDISKAFTTFLKNYLLEKGLDHKNRIIPYNRQTIYQLSEKYFKTNPHAFRHGYAIALYRKTKNIRYVQKQLGHSTLSTTQVYLQFADYDQEKSLLEEL